jgi:hypothetical protein
LDARAHQLRDRDIRILNKECVRSVVLWPGVNNTGKPQHGRKIWGGDPHQAQTHLSEHRGEIVVDEHPTLADNDHAFRERLDLFEIVASEHHGSSGILLAAHRFPQGSTSIHIKAGGRFIEQHKFGPADKGERNAESALLTAGKGAGLAFQQFGETVAAIERAQRL